MEFIYGQGGKVIGSLHKSGSTVNGERVDVYDGLGQYVGYVDDSGTYDDMGSQGQCFTSPRATVIEN